MLPADRRRRAHRVLGATAAALFFLILAGATYQGVATAIERHRFTRPGGMVDVGGHQLHVYCMGTGTPTVVLEAPAAGVSLSWGWVQPQVAKATRTCSYDRAGLGWSERGDDVYQPEATASELDRLLAQTQETGPFVVVGEGLGAALATAFAARFGNKIAALVLINSPTAHERLPAADVNSLTAWLARVGIMRATNQIEDYAAGLPPSSEGAMRAFLNRPDHLARAAEELARWNEIVKAANAAALRSDLPIARVETLRHARIRFLASQSAAAPVVTAILDAVARVRTPPIR
jgi:pimeloyl-ACP methyl ester carboxylesterase